MYSFVWMSKVSKNSKSGRELTFENFRSELTLACKNNSEKSVLQLRFPIHLVAGGKIKRWPLPLRMKHPRDPPNRETWISRYRFKLNQNLDLNLYREIQRNLSFPIWQISGMQYLQWILTYSPDFWEFASGKLNGVCSTKSQKWLRLRLLKIELWRDPAIQGVYGVTTISRPLEIIGLFCKRAL